LRQSGSVADQSRTSRITLPYLLSAGIDASPASTTLRGSVSKNAAEYMPLKNMPP
jgi:hypothetical protein